LATDSNSWLDHLNSIMHNRLLGMNMKVDKVTAVDVKEKL
jgi:U4/U6.U5 tri-snRNP component SNU23